METEYIRPKVKERQAWRIVLGAKENAGTKNGIVYIILAFFVCVIGVHNFYAGYVKRGIVQLFLTLVSPMFMFIPLLVVAFWGLGEMLFVNKSANGKIMRGNRSVIWGLRLVALGFLGYSLLTTELVL